MNQLRKIEKTSLIFTYWMKGGDEKWQIIFMASPISTTHRSQCSHNLMEIYM